MTMTQVLLVGGVAVVAALSVLYAAPAAPRTPWVVAHRGASAYAPENTVPAFTRAAEQGATFVEIDLQRTRDGALVVLHDSTLERTTDVEDVFPDRARVVTVRGEARRQWPLADFTLDEIRRLDAGRWFDARFAGTRIPTFGEAIAAVRGRTGLFIELKAPDQYPGIEREMIAVDGSARNRITGNRFELGGRPGVFLYRNCGERGVIRHQTPSYNIITDNAFTGVARWRPRLVVENARQGGRAYCGADKGYPWGSSADDRDGASQNAVYDNFRK